MAALGAQLAETSAVLDPCFSFLLFSFSSASPSCLCFLFGHVKKLGGGGGGGCLVDVGPTASLAGTAGRHGFRFSSHVTEYYCRIARHRPVARRYREGSSVRFPGRFRAWTAEHGHSLVREKRDAFFFLFFLYLCLSERRYT